MENPIQAFKDLSPKGKIFAVGAAGVTVAVVVIAIRNKQASSSSSGSTPGGSSPLGGLSGTSGAPNSSGVPYTGPADSGAGPGDLTSLLQQILAAVQASTGSTSGSSGQPGTGKTTQPKGSTPMTAAAQYTTVGKWTQTNTPWNSTMSGIATHYGETLAQLEALNPQVTNPNVIQQGQQIRVH